MTASSDKNYQANQNKECVDTVWCRHFYHSVEKVEGKSLIFKIYFIWLFHDSTRCSSEIK